MDDIDRPPLAPLAPDAQLSAHLSDQQRGEQMRRQVMGRAYVDAKTHDPEAFDAPYQDLITRYAWGAVWSRSGSLSVRERHLVTLAILAALGRERELRGHLRATPNSGVSQSDLQDVLLHVTAYAGAPAGGSAFALASEVLAELKAQP